MSEWIVKRRFLTYKVEATTRSKARYAAYKIYCSKSKNPVSFYEFFTTVSKVKRLAYI